MSRKRKENDESQQSAEEEPNFDQQEDVKTYQTNDELDVEFRVRVLADLLTCRMCGGFFKDAMTVKECLHTFCKSCIYGYLSKQDLRKKCYCPYPDCGEDLGAQPFDAVESDRTLQNLVDKLFPEFAEREKKEREGLYRFCGLDHLLEDSPGVPEQNGLSAPAPKEKIGGGEATEELHKMLVKGRYREVLQSDLTFMLLPKDDSLGPLSRPYLRTNSQMTVGHLMKYLVKKMNLHDTSEVQIMCEKQVCARSHTLEFLNKTRRMDRDKYMVLHYRRMAKDKSLWVAPPPKPPPVVRKKWARKNPPQDKAAAAAAAAAAASAGGAGEGREGEGENAIPSPSPSPSPDASQSQSQSAREERESPSLDNQNAVQAEGEEEGEGEEAFNGEAADGQEEMADEAKEEDEVVGAHVDIDMGEGERAEASQEAADEPMQTSQQEEEELGRGGGDQVAEGSVQPDQQQGGGGERSSQQPVDEDCVMDDGGSTGS
ncbi:unnamed protein product [Vitrella brassicaformis CCMP3155]|uniref:RING-type domain-containing protein n=1 Tax=Vitrella brassicaformis (strain CCMP3155) TaxID=1169540 RepID=A0A0G4G8N5_VITBC|nr:unnamed protein product [Vitrella brassicaformis CCMP3155]|eukprot:CEM25057.1 unnamed protein product [Vitrella brassicaformis CCMP3155]